jgi:hypothetical protein
MAAVARGGANNKRNQKQRLAQVPGYRETRKLPFHQKPGKNTGTHQETARFQQGYGPSLILICGALVSQREKNNPFFNFQFLS